MASRPQFGFGSEPKNEFGGSRAWSKDASRGQGFLISPRCRSEPCEMRPLKIVHITWNTGIGGLEQLVIDIANEQIRDAQVWIIAINGRPSESASERLNP